MVVRNGIIPPYELHIEDTEIQQVQKNKYLGNVLNREREMRQLNPKAHWNRERCFPEAKQRIKKKKKLLRDKKKRFIFG